jgi:hypothetical protein
MVASLAPDYGYWHIGRLLCAEDYVPYYQYDRKCDDAEQEADQ